MRIISVNVNGIQAAAERGLLSWLQAQNADVICLQDTRASAFELDDPAFQLDGYFLYACDAEVPAQGGVALYSRMQPKAVITGLASRQPTATGVTCKQISTKSVLPACCCLRV